MKAIYTFLMTLLLIIVWPVAAMLAFFGHPGLLRRLVPPGDIPEDRILRVWIHAASVGESNIAFSAAKEIRNRKPGSLVFISTTTPTGLARITGLMRDSGCGIVERAFLAPFDHPFVVNAFLRSLRPTLFLLVETELWPSILTALTRKHIPVAIINGKLGRTTFRRYRVFGGSLNSMAINLAVVCVQSRTFARRYLMLGVPPDRIEVLGNIKFDNLPDRSAFPPGSARSTLGIPEDARLFVAGSVRPGEEEIIAEAFSEVLSRHPDAVMVIAPRHLNRVPVVEGILSEAGLSHRKRSVPPEPESAPVSVVILDTLGELAGVFASADVAFVGGSLRDYGGHNPLEPAALGIPVLFGPFMQQTGARQLLSGGAALIVNDVRELVETISALFDDTERRKLMAESGPKVVSRFTGVLARTIRCLETRGLLEIIDGNALRQHRTHQPE